MTAAGVILLGAVPAAGSSRPGSRQPHSATAAAARVQACLARAAGDPALPGRAVRHRSGFRILPPARVDRRRSACSFTFAWSEHDIVVIQGRADRYPISPPRGRSREGSTVFTGFKNFLMRGDVIVVAVGLVIALAFSTLIAAFTTDIINPIVARAQGSNSVGLGVQLGSDDNQTTFLNFGALISSIIYFVVFMAVVYFVIVVPYKTIQARRGQPCSATPPRSRPARPACPATCRPPPASASTAAPTSRAGRRLTRPGRPRGGPAHLASA